jgi:hypothetical protein
MVFDQMPFDQMVFDVIYIRSYDVRSNGPSIKWSFDLLFHSRLVTFDLVVGRLFFIWIFRIFTWISPRSLENFTILFLKAQQVRFYGSKNKVLFLFYILFIFAVFHAINDHNIIAQLLLEIL